jgi:hypothetical protein
MAESPAETASCVATKVVLPLEPSPSMGPSMGEGLGGGDAAQLLGDRLMDAVEICQDFVVPKPQNAIALVTQVPASLGLPRRRAIVLAPVDFHDQASPPGTQSRAHKIGNVAADRHLAAELVPRHLMGAQDLPDTPLRLRHVPP